MGILEGDNLPKPFAETDALRAEIGQLKRQVSDLYQTTSLLAETVTMLLRLQNGKEPSRVQNPKSDGGLPQRPAQDRQQEIPGNTTISQPSMVAYPESKA